MCVSTCTLTHTHSTHVFTSKSVALALPETPPCLGGTKSLDPGSGGACNDAARPQGALF